MAKHTLSVLVENKFGVLAHVAGLFSARGWNIQSLSVGETDDPSLSRMVIVVDGDERTLEAIKKQLNKLINVIKVMDLTHTHFVDRELILIKVAPLTPQARDEVVQIASATQAQVIHADSRILALELVGAQEKIDALVELLRPFNVKEIVRTGRVAMQLDGEGIHGKKESSHEALKPQKRFKSGEGKAITDVDRFDA